MRVGQPVRPIDIEGRVDICIALGAFSVRLHGQGRRISPEGIAICIDRSLVDELGREVWMDLMTEGRQCSLHLQLDQFEEDGNLPVKVAAYREHAEGWDIAFVFTGRLPAIYRPRQPESVGPEQSHATHARGGDPYESSHSYNDWSSRFDQPGGDGRGAVL